MKKKLIFIICIISLIISSCQKQATIRFYTGYQESSLSQTDQMDTVIAVRDRYMESGQWSEALIQYENILENLKKDNEDKSRTCARLYSYMAEAYIYMEDQDNAEKYLDKAIKVCTENKDDFELANVYNTMVILHVALNGDVEEGLEYAEKAESIYRKEPELAGVLLAGVIGNKGCLYLHGKDYEKALDCFEEELSIATSGGADTIDFADMYINTGRAYSGLGDYEKAIENLDKAQAIAKSLENSYLLGKVNLRKAEAYERAEIYDRAVEHYKEAINSYELIGKHQRQIAEIHNSIGYTYAIEMGKLELGLEEILIACQISEKISPVTKSVQHGKEVYKHNLYMCYQGLYGEVTEDEFEVWYQEKVFGEELNTWE